MKIDNSKVRRQDRLLSDEKIIEILKDGEYGFLSISLKGQPYGVPISYAWDGENSIYFHSAPDGYKINILKTNTLASFCVVRKTRVIPEKFTTEYESIILKGKMDVVYDLKQCVRGFELLVEKYSSSHKQEGMKYAHNSLQRTSILRFDIQEASGKGKLA